MPFSVPAGDALTKNACRPIRLKPIEKFNFFQILPETVARFWPPHQANRTIGLVRPSPVAGGGYTQLFSSSQGRAREQFGGCGPAVA
jgi:hypothetical protein